jgi:hypothetical protein
MTAAVAFFLFVISGNDMPDLTALAGYETAKACNVAAEQVRQALASGHDGKLVLCIDAASLTEMAKKNGLRGK